MHASHVDLQFKKHCGGSQVCLPKIWFSTPGAGLENNGCSIVQKGELSHPVDSGGLDPP